MSYGYPGPGGQEQPPPPGQPPQQWQQPGPGWQQPPPPPGWQQPGPGWGGPPQSPRGSNTGLIVGLSIAGVVVLLLIAVGVIGVMAVSHDSSKNDNPVARATASERTAAPTDEAKEAPADEASPQASGPEGDVRITKCEVDPLTTWASADLQITNSTSKVSDYIVNVEFVDGSGKRLGEALAATNNLAPGQKADETAQGLDEIPGKMECRVTKVTRYQH